jgi:hypothetical protein
MTTTVTDILATSLIRGTNETIERLRADRVTGHGGAPFTPRQVLDVVYGLYQLRGLDDILAESGLADGDAVNDVVAVLGTFLSHSLGGADLDVAIYDPPPGAARPLMHAWIHAPVGKTEKQRAAAADQRAAEMKAYKVRARRNKWELRPDTAYFAPDVFELIASRDLMKSAAAIVSSRPTASTVIRFMGRKFRPVNNQLTVQHLMIIQFFAKLEMLDSVDETSDAPEYRSLLVDAYDTLEVARMETMSAIAELCADGADLADLRHSVAKLRVLHEAEAARLARFIDAAVAPGASAAAEKLARRELAFFKTRVLTTPADYVVEHVGQLNNGQVHRIGETAGVSRRDVTHQLESRIRLGIDERGLNKDTDLLLELGIRAAQMGDESEQVFWGACDAFRRGDADWRDNLDRIFAVV